MKIEVTDVRNELDDAFVASQLRAYNATSMVRDFKLLRVFARDTNGSIIGGLLADTYWQYLEVHKLWVGEAHRNAGHASRLMDAAEDEARLSRHVQGIFALCFFVQRDLGINMLSVTV